jgi:hypothetical protein
MTNHSKTTKDRNKKTGAKIADLEPQRDPKGGIIAVLIDLNTTSPKPTPPPPPPTTK